MIAGYAQAKQFLSALALFRKMQAAKVKPDEIILTSVLSACAHLGALGLGERIHQYIQRNHIKADVYIGNSLIDMYSKCRRIMEALQVFGNMEEKDTLTWNSIIFGLATNGFVDSALKVFSDMLCEDFQPDDVTFLGVLIACAHSGLVDEGLRYFESMRDDHGIEPKMKHYGCVVHLLCRHGELEKAFEFIEKMPMEPDSVIWRMLLGGCKVHGNVELAEKARKKLVDVGGMNGDNFELLSNTYSTNVWEIMAGTESQKKPGCNLIEVGKFDDNEDCLENKNHAVVG